MKIHIKRICRYKMQRCYVIVCINDVFLIYDYEFWSQEKGILALHLKHCR